MRRRALAWALVASSLAFIAGARGRTPRLTYPTRPGEREFVADGADLVAPAERAKIEEICDELLTERKIPIIVVTIRSLAEFGAGGWSIRTYAQNLFNEWGIGFPEWNHGMLLLVARGDRRATIELGAGWGRRQDARCRRIMDELIIPQFKRGDFSEGILAGVKGLDAIARGLQPPSPPRPWWHYALWAAVIGLTIFTIVSLIRRGSSGWAWLLWGALFAGVGFLLYQLFRPRARGFLGGSGGWGGSWSGGSFGGGFSGGGGASGSW